MLNKFIKDFAIVILAYLLASSLVSRLVGMVFYSMLPGNDPAISVMVLATAFGLSYLGVWFFFSQWKARFWIKACTIVGVIILSRVAFTLVDMNAVYNMSHH